MPRSVMQLILLAPEMFNDPKLRSYFTVYTDCLVEKVTEEIGYEAVLSDISYSIKSFENVGFKVKFSGYSDKLFIFARIFLKLMVKVRETGFEELTVKLAVEKAIKSHKNANVEVDQRTANNRLIYLLENVFHANLVIKALESFDYHEF